jgi:hypothetical protein
MPEGKCTARASAVRKGTTQFVIGFWGNIRGQQLFCS